MFEIARLDIRFDLFKRFAIVPLPKYYIQIEGLSQDGSTISNQATEGEISTMVVVKCLDKVEGLVDNIDAPLYGVL